MEMSWATIEREAYADLFGLQKLHKYLHGNLVEIITHHFREEKTLAL